MASKFKVGDHVTWNSEAGHVSGRIVKVHTENVNYKGYLSCKSISLAEKSGPEFRTRLTRNAKRSKRLCSSTTFGARSIDG